MEDEDIINNDFLVDPTQNMGLSGVATSRDPLIAQGSRASDIVELGPEAFLDRSSYQNVNDMYNYYLGGGSPIEPVIETPAITTPVITTPAVGTGGQDQSTSIQDQVTGDLNNQDSDQDIQTSNQINNSGITGDDIFMEDISSGDPYTGSLTVAPGLSNQTGTIQGAPDIFDINEIGDPALNPDSTMVQGLDPYGEEDLKAAENPMIVNAYNSVLQGVSSAADFIAQHGKKIYDIYGLVKGGSMGVITGGSSLLGLNPVTGLIGLGLSKVADIVKNTPSQLEYDSYSDEQKEIIEQEYGPGGIMEGYNTVSAFGEGIEATIESRLAERTGNGIYDETTERLQNLANTVNPSRTNITAAVYDFDDDSQGEQQTFDSQQADQEFAETGDYDVYSGDTGTTSSPTPAPDYSYEGSDEQDNDNDSSSSSSGSSGGGSSSYGGPR